MAGTTANNSWPYPDSTDFVADGATAIENLADAIDSTLGVGTDLTRGHFGSVKFNSNVSIPTAGVAHGVTFTADANRRYEIRGAVATYSATVTGYVTITLRIGATVYARGYVGVTSANPYGTAYVTSGPISGLSGSVTAEAFIEESANAMYAAGGTERLTYVDVFDVGGV